MTFQDDKDGSTTVVQAPVGKSILEVAHDNHVELEGAGGGRGGEDGRRSATFFLPPQKARSRGETLTCTLPAGQARARGPWRAPPAT